MKEVKLAVTRALIPLMSRYMRQKRLSFGKELLWHKFVYPYLAWRDIQFETVTESGHVVAGSLSDIIFRHIYFFGVWEPAVTNYLRGALKDGDIMIDVGSNIGVHTLFASSCVGATGTVHAVEASPTIFHRLSKTLERNAITNVIAHNATILATRRPVSIFMHDSTNFGATTVMQHRVEKDIAAYTSETTVQGEPLVDVVGESALRSARVIKIDVEGAELEVLQGILPYAKYLHNDVSIIVECTSDSLLLGGLTKQGFLSLLADHGLYPMELPHTFSAKEYLGKSDVSLHATCLFESDQVDLVFRKKR